MNDNYCPDAMNSDDEEIVELKDCGASLYEAEYCVKTTGVEGGRDTNINSTKRVYFAFLYTFAKTLTASEIQIYK